ncbi:MAG: membrane-bound lytic murein transglycosylase D [Candidatus Kentron sp. G]|nr:MAG: membrane-bound lytic murein transglycosylase D [Candidatus Kentron sp. G]VFM97752.1 MAG: membrane-bound lytic murein transglycosylase D [Candidatus Kentron sp. G]VFM99748.1 MAG: membrane-bound lytic murein transglycosylase D [Candidatus Kentron sp. G]
MTIERPFAFYLTGLLLLLAMLGTMPGCGLFPVDPESHDDLWDRVRASLSLQYAYRKSAVRERRDWFLRNPGYLARSGKRGRRYLYHIIKEVERREMPAEIALLPIVESAFRPFAYSPSHASGIWQFIPATGKRYGLEQNWWYDGRRDIPEATRAALTYLEELNRRFDGDWLLAIAAYNAGEGTVERAIRRNRSAGRRTDFWSLDLPSETRKYVPKLLAVASLVEDPDRYDLSLESIPNRLYFQQVPIHGPIELELAAKAARLSLEEFRNLNPAFRRWVTDPAGPHHLLVPKNKVKIFRKAMATIPGNRRVRWHEHIVKPGESLNTIAAWFKTTVPVLQQLNPSQGKTLTIGRAILIPTPPRANYQPNTSAGKTKSRTGKKKRRIHVVRPGENLWNIARRYGLSLAQLLSWNRLSRNSVLKPGQRLRLYRLKK